MMSKKIDELFDADYDEKADPLWAQAGLMAEAPPQPVSKGHGVYSLEWLARVMPVLHTPTQLGVALLIYRECLMRRSQTVALSNGTLKALRVTRYTKYRALRCLQQAGA